MHASFGPMGLLEAVVVVVSIAPRESDDKSVAPLAALSGLLPETIGRFRLNYPYRYCCSDYDDYGDDYDLVDDKLIATQANNQ